MRELILLGGGGHSGAVAAVAREAGWVVAGVLSKDEQVGSGLVRLGDDNWLDTPDAARYQFIVAVGQVTASPLRQTLFSELQRRRLAVGTLKAPDVRCADNASIGLGTVLMHGVMVGPQARVGANCIINTGAIIEHDVEVSAHCHVSTGAILNGGVSVGAGTLIGSGAIVLQQLHVGESVVVGAGAVVTENLSDPGIYVGVPARRIK